MCIKSQCKPLRIYVNPKTAGEEGQFDLPQRVFSKNVLSRESVKT